MKDRFCDRLCLLIDEKIEEKNKPIRDKNQELYRKDRLRLEEWKNKIQRGDKPAPLDKIPEYTRERLMSDFQNTYNIPMSRSKLGQYKNGTIVPPEKVIHCFADFFHVSYDYIIGNSNVRNYDTANLSDYLNLDEKALETLLSLNSDDTAMLVLNALLHDADATQRTLVNLYLQSYSQYKKDNDKSNSIPEYDSQPTLDKISRALALYDYVHDLIRPFVQDKFAIDLSNDMQDTKYRREHPQEENASIADAASSDEVTDSVNVTISNVSIIKEEDGQ